MPSSVNNERMHQINSGFPSTISGVPAVNSNPSDGEKFYSTPPRDMSRDSYKNLQKSTLPLNFAPVERRKSTEDRNNNEVRFNSHQNQYSFSNRSNSYTPISTERIQSNPPRSDTLSRPTPKNFSAQFFPLPYYGPSSDIDYFSSCHSMGFPVNTNAPLDYSRSTYSAMYGMQDGPSKHGFDKQGRNSFVSPSLGKVSHL